MAESGMHIVFHHDAFYDWEPVPDGVKVLQRDIDAHRVKPASDGKWLMRVTRDADTHTHVMLSEGDVWNRALHFELKYGVRKGRAKTVAELLEERILWQHAHKKHLTHFHVNDDGPQEAPYRAFLEALRNDKQEPVFDAATMDEMVADYVSDKDAKLDHYLDKYFSTKGAK